MSSSSSFSRRNLFKASALAAAAGIIAVGAPQAQAQDRILGTVIDYAAGVPTAASVKAAGHIGAVRYVSGRRPGADWMAGKPVTAAETQDFAAAGLAVASVYQFGKDTTADWKAGAAGAAVHAPQAIAYHRAAGGPTGRPIYIAIDDDPTRAQYDRQIRPYLQAFSAALNLAGYQTGVYGNYSTIEWAIADGIGEYFWQHKWGSNGKIHPRAALYQVRIDDDADSIGGLGVDVNYVYAQDWGQWTPGQTGTRSLPTSDSLDLQQLTDLANQAIRNLSS